MFFFVFFQLENSENGQKIGGGPKFGNFLKSGFDLMGG